MGKLIGFARVSTKALDTSRQILDLIADGTDDVQQEVGPE